MQNQRDHESTLKDGCAPSARWGFSIGAHSTQNIKEKLLISSCHFNLTLMDEVMRNFSPLNGGAFVFPLQKQDKNFS